MTAGRPPHRVAGALQTAEDGALTEERWGRGWERTNWGILAQAGGGVALVP